MVTTDMCVRKSHKWDNYGIDLLKSKPALPSIFARACRTSAMPPQLHLLIRIGAPSTGYGHLRSFKTFTKLTTPKLLFDWGYATIDADINFLKSDGLYHMLIKKEGGKSGKNY